MSLPVPVPLAQTSYFDAIFVGGGLVSWILLLLSAAVLAWVLILLFACRQHTLCPRELYNGLVDRLGDGDPGGARRFLDEEPSTLARMVEAGLAAQLDGEPPDRVEAAVEAAGADEHARWTWRIGYIALAAAVAPMLGLLGTVVGMIDAFNTLGLSERITQQSELGRAISKALITTHMGLVIAIPALVAHALLRHRLGLVMLQCATRAKVLMGLFRQSRAGRVN